MVGTGFKHGNRWVYEKVAKCNKGSVRITNNTFLALPWTHVPQRGSVLGFPHTGSQKRSLQFFQEWSTHMWCSCTHQTSLSKLPRQLVISQRSEDHTFLSGKVTALFLKIPPKGTPTELRHLEDVGCVLLTPILLGPIST